MRHDEEIDKVYTKEEDVKNIVDKIRNFSFNNLKKRKHYFDSIIQKDTNEEELKEYFNKFDKIKIIFYRKRKSGYNNYDLHYLKENGTYIIYSINLDKNPPELINAIPVDRNFENFKKQIIKKYWKELI